jgi:hypothetical protein
MSHWKADTRAVCKVHGLTLLLQVRTLWRCGDDIFFKVPPLASDTFLMMLHPLLRNVLQDCWSFWNFLPWSSLFMVGKVQKSQGARSEMNSVFGSEKVDRWNPIRTSTIQSRSCPTWFLGFSNREKGAPRQEILKWSMVCNMFLRSRWSVVRMLCLPREVLWKRDCHSTSTNFWLRVIRWVHELFEWPLYMETLI